MKTPERECCTVKDFERNLEPHTGDIPRAEQLKNAGEPQRGDAVSRADTQDTGAIVTTGSDPDAPGKGRRVAWGPSA